MRLGLKATLDVRQSWLIRSVDPLRQLAAGAIHHREDPKRTGSARAAVSGLPADSPL